MRKPADTRRSRSRCTTDLLCRGLIAGQATSLVFARRRTSPCAACIAREVQCAMDWRRMHTKAWVARRPLCRGRYYCLVEVSCRWPSCRGFMPPGVSANPGSALSSIQSASCVSSPFSGTHWFAVPSANPSAGKAASHVQFLDDRLIRLLHDKLVAWLGVFAEQFLERRVRLEVVVDLDFQKRARLRVERRLREHLERHFAEALEPRDVHL